LQLFPLQPFLLQPSLLLHFQLLPLVAASCSGLVLGPSYKLITEAPYLLLSHLTSLVLLEEGYHQLPVVLEVLDGDPPELV
jgi:hypothetical protein